MIASGACMELPIDYCVLHRLRRPHCIPNPDSYIDVSNRTMTKPVDICESASDTLPRREHVNLFQNDTIARRMRYPSLRPLR